MESRFVHTTASRTSVNRFEAVNAVTRNTYVLLAMTILFSAFTAFISTLMTFNLDLTLLFFCNLALIMVINKTKNSVWGLVAVFAFTGLMGLSLGPVFKQLFAYYKNGTDILIGSLGLTSGIFLSLSYYVAATRKNFSYLAGFLIISTTVAAFVAIMSLLFNFPITTLIYSAFIVLLAAGWILYDTSRIINGGEQNYIIATVNIYINIFNLFVHLLRLLSVLAGKRD